MAVANAAKEALWLKTLLGDFTGSIKSVNIYVDNQGALKLIHHPHSHQRTKHIDIAYRFIQDYVEKEELTCEYIETGKMVADCITKAVPRTKLEENKRDMGLEEIPHTAKNGSDGGWGAHHASEGRRLDIILSMAGSMWCLWDVPNMVSWLSHMMVLHLH